MKRIGLAMLAAALALLVGWDSALAARPNVLFIAVDDLNAWVTHLGQNPQARTPNIDRLARRGVTFKQAYCRGSRLRAFTMCVDDRPSALDVGLLFQRRRLEETLARRPRSERSIPEGWIPCRRRRQDLP